MNVDCFYFERNVRFSSNEEVFHPRSARLLSARALEQFIVLAELPPRVHRFVVLAPSGEIADLELEVLCGP